MGAGHHYWFVFTASLRGAGACPRDISGEEPFGTAVDNRLALVFQRAGRMAYDVLQGTLFRTAGSRHARNGERMRRCFRDAATYWTPRRREHGRTPHVGASMAEPVDSRAGCDRLGLPSDDIALIP